MYTIFCCIGQKSHLNRSVEGVLRWMLAAKCSVNLSHNKAERLPGWGGRKLSQPINDRWLCEIYKLFAFCTVMVFLERSTIS